jgi:hypothetical protein
MVLVLLVLVLVLLCCNCCAAFGAGRAVAKRGVRIFRFCILQLHLLN